jgi:hypothetical protein
LAASMVTLFFIKITLKKAKANKYKTLQCKAA